MSLYGRRRERRVQLVREAIRRLGGPVVSTMDLARETNLTPHMVGKAARELRLPRFTTARGGTHGALITSTAYDTRGLLGQDGGVQ